MADVGFTLNDLFEFFALKGGKVVYSEIVTNFKSALSNPETLAEARNQFKDHVNTLATVTNENGTKYLVLRPKFMKKLAALADESFHNNHASSRTAAVAAEMIPIVPNSAAVSNNSNVPQKQPPPPPSQPVLPPQAQYPQYPLPQAHSQPQYHHHHHHHHSNGSNGANHFEAPAAAQIATRPSHLMMMNNGASSMSSNSVMGTPSSNYNHHHHHPHLHQQSQNIHHQQQQQHQHLQQSFPGDSAPRNVSSSAPLPAPPLPSVSFSPLTGSSNNHSMAEGTSTTCTTPMTPGDSPDGSEAPPRPPPRKKASFSKQSRPTPPPPSAIHQASAGAAPVQTPPSEGAPPAPSAENQENQKPLPPTPQVNGGGTLEKKKNHTVKKEIQELARTPGRVKEHAQILNKLALTTDQPQKLPLPPTTTSATTTFTGSSVHANVVAKIRSGFHGGGTASGNDSDSGSIQIIDTLKKRWIIAASNCDYAELVALLKEDANLAAYGDFITGFTALHWAAKFNRPNIIKLLVGRYGIDPNVRSFSGSTPLHLAAQFRHQAIVQLLTEVYGAKEDIRDNYGKKALQYLETGDQTAKYEGKYGGGGDHTDHHHHHHLKSNGQNNGGPWSVNGGSNSGGKGGSSTTAANENGGGSGSSGMTPKTSIMSLRNKISHQSMLVRNKFRQSKAIVQKRKSSFSNK